ncbi:MAG: hypothetical protein MZV64_17290 [Ignavibacteriales bacterium]|nr:hypothetical protein [Ignavibacteriales bacterium]
MVPQPGWTASPLSPALSRAKASAAADLTSSVSKFPSRKKPVGLECPAMDWWGYLRASMWSVACSSAWLRRVSRIRGRLRSMRGLYPAGLSDSRFPVCGRSRAG